MDFDITFDPAGTFDEVSSLLDSLELSGGWEILSIASSNITKKRMDLDNKLIFASETLIDRVPEDIAESILDYSQRKKWDRYCLAIEPLFQWGKSLQLIYYQQKYKWPLSNRDFVLIQGVIKEPDQKIIIGWKSVEYDKKPQTLGVVRGALEFGGFVITKVSDTMSHVTFIEKSTPSGSVPQVFITSMQKKSLGIVLDLKTYLKPSHYQNII